jgi:hypothetical protein
VKNIRVPPVEVATIRPPSRIRRAASCMVKNALLVLAAKIASKSSSEHSTSGLTIASAALAKTMSSGPSALSASSKRRSTSVGSPRSACTAMAVPPSPVISATTASASVFRLRYPIATAAPRDARPLAIALPIPREPPVTSAAFPSSSIKSEFLLLDGFTELEEAHRRPEPEGHRVSGTRWISDDLMHPLELGVRVCIRPMHAARVICGAAHSYHVRPAILGRRIFWRRRTRTDEVVPSRRRICPLSRRALVLLRCRELAHNALELLRPQWAYARARVNVTCVTPLGDEVASTS